jgi:hypothetical protein
MARLPSVIERALEEVGQPYEIVRGKKHNQLRIGGRLVAILHGGRPGGGATRHNNNTAADIRRWAKQGRGR